MKKFSFGLLAAAALVAPVKANDSPAGEAVKPQVCPTNEAGGPCLEHHCCIRDTSTDGSTMTAVPGGDGATLNPVPGSDGSNNGTSDPTIMYMTGMVSDGSGGPTRHQDGDNQRDIVPIHTMNLAGGLGLGGGSQAKFEGLTQNAYERRSMPGDRSFGGDRSSLKSMLFGKKEAATKTTLVANEKVRMQKMAQVDKLRDQALATGDAKLMAKADAMEKEVKVEANAKASTKFSLFGRK